MVAQRVGAASRARLARAPVAFVTKPHKVGICRLWRVSLWFDAPLLSNIATPSVVVLVRGSLGIVTVVSSGSRGIFTVVSSGPNAAQPETNCRACQLTGSGQTGQVGSSGLPAGHRDIL